MVDESRGPGFKQCDTIEEISSEDDMSIIIGRPPRRLKEWRSLVSWS